MDPLRAALGITPRSSSAVLVSICGPPATPRLLDRRLIDLVGAGMPAHVYHAAASLYVTEAEALIQRWARMALDAAGGGVARALRVSTAAGCRVVAAGIVADVRDVPALAVALRSHPLLHAGEGQLSREAVAAAGLDVHHRGPREPVDPALAERVGGMAQQVGPPWRKEHKLAAAAALAALSARPQ